MTISSAIYHAIANNNLQIFKRLVQAGADLNIPFDTDKSKESLSSDILYYVFQTVAYQILDDVLPIKSDLNRLRPNGLAPIHILAREMNCVSDFNSSFQFNGCGVFKSRMVPMLIKAVN